MSEQDDQPQSTGINRRQLLIGAGVVAAAAGCVSDSSDSNSSDIRSGALAPARAPIPDLRVAVVGTGQRGLYHVQIHAELANARVVSVCDLLQERTQTAADVVTGVGGAEPAQFFAEGGFERMLADGPEFDYLVIATPWDTHTSYALRAIKRGIHVGIEVPVSQTLEECWQLVDATEEHNVHCFMLENANYAPTELMVLNMVREGLFGEVIHAAGAYLHDLRKNMFDPARGLNPPYWRAQYSYNLDANHYPTHGLGPIANYMDINRGDRFTSLFSYSTVARGMEQYRNEHFPEAPLDGPFACGDVVTTILKTALGKTIHLSYSVAAPRPYSRINWIQGTKAAFEGFPTERVYFEEVGDHRWEDAAEYKAQYDHPLWQGRTPTGAHGGADKLMVERIAHQLINGEKLDMDIYDAVALSAANFLSAESIASGQAVEFPDFTRGRHTQREATGYYAQS